MATRRDDAPGGEAVDGIAGRRDGSGRQAVFESLFDHLARVRSGSHPHGMATRLLRRETEARRLVALVDDGRQAVFFDAAAGGLVAVPFDEHGLADEATVGLLAAAGPATWVAANCGTTGWVHPRYRTSGSE